MKLLLLARDFSGLISEGDNVRGLHPVLCFELFPDYIVLRLVFQILFICFYCAACLSLMEVETAVGACLNTAFLSRSLAYFTEAFGGQPLSG